MTYTIGNHGCDIRKDGEMIMAVEVLILLEQRDRLLEAALGAIAALSQTAVFDADIDAAKTWLARAAGTEAEDKSFRSQIGRIKQAADKMAAEMVDLDPGFRAGWVTYLLEAIDDMEPDWVTLPAVSQALQQRLEEGSW
jgi:hypothetical protein